MSSTNRGGARVGYDYYRTPIDQITLFLREFEKREPGVLKNSWILDSAAGGDEDHPMSYPEALMKFGVERQKILTMDIREDSRAEIKGDYLNYDFTSHKFDMVISNPPFLYARQFIEKGLREINENGFVIMLLRLNFFESKERKPLFDSIMPKYTFVHHKRMSFTESGKTDSVAYCHHIYAPNWREKYSMLHVI